MRHNKVCTHLHYSICKALGIKMTDKWYTSTPKPLYEQEDVTVMGHQTAYTDRDITANRADIIIENKKYITCILIDVAIPMDRNVMQKEADKKLKYKSMCTEIQQMWNMKCMILPAIIRTTRIITKV